MVIDILAIAKYTVLFAGSFYGYLKLAKIKIRLINLLELLFSLLLSAGLYYATKQIRILVPIGFLLLTCLYCFVRYRRSAMNTVTLGVISCGITIIIMAITFIISIPFEFLVYKFVDNDAIRKIIITVLMCVLQLIGTFLSYRIKRFKSGISVQNNDGSIELLLLISILSVFLMTLFYRDNIKSPIEIILLTLIFCGLGFIVLWKKHITNSYINKIHKRNEELYEQRIEEYEKERDKLLDQNDELSKIIHRDNKLIPAIAAAVQKIIEDAPDKKDYKDMLIQIEKLSAERREVIDEYQAKSDTLPKTGSTALDAVIHFLNNKALQSGISAEFKVNGAAIPPLLDCVKNHTDLNTVLCDLGENAIIAAKNIPNGKILIEFGTDGANMPSICFYDNGARFDDKVIANMGKRRITTHKSEGGNGIGLMTLFEILNKYNASYLLDERLADGEYTKQIKITFDNLHEIKILCEQENNQ